MSLADLDRARWEADQRVESRLSARGQTSPLDAVPAPRPFVLADPGRPLNGKDIPQVRLDLIEFLRQHPGEWVRYDAADGVEDATPRQIAKLATSGSGGFGPGFSATTRERQSVVFVRYTPVGGDA